MNILLLIKTLFSKYLKSLKLLKMDYYPFLPMQALSILIVLMNFSASVSEILGYKSNLIFPYPCNCSAVTLQQWNRPPFYNNSQTGFSLSLRQDQVQRFSIQNIVDNGTCSLNLTISDLMTDDQGTYLSTVYYQGELIKSFTERIWLKLDTPPGKQTCEVGDDKGGDWVELDCTSSVGSIAGKIECYQNDVWMPAITDPIETEEYLKQIILIRRSQPVFCCSSPLSECISRCDCNDTSVYLTEDDSNNPCPTFSETMMPLLPIVNNKANDSIDVSCPPCPKEKECAVCTCTCTKYKIVLSLSFFIAMIQLFLIFHSKYELIRADDII